MRLWPVLFGPALLLTVRAAWADCGSIPFKPTVIVYEPYQRALIAFDGRDEILLLSTDLRASEPGKVLEVIPFPSRPRVRKGSFKVFRRANELILKRFPPLVAGIGEMGGRMGLGGGKARPPAGVVAMQKKIGAHDISVVRVVDRAGFVDWVKDYLKESGVDNPTIPPPLESVVEEYLGEDFQWFAFNVVELGTETQTKEVVQYRFKSRFLYYPLRITRAEQGQTAISLLILTPGLVEMPDLGATKITLGNEPIRITSGELRYLGGELNQLLARQAPLMLRTWNLEGPLSGFQKDILTR